MQRGDAMTELADELTEADMAAMWVAKSQPSPEVEVVPTLAVAHEDGFTPVPADVSAETPEPTREPDPDSLDVLCRNQIP